MKQRMLIPVGSSQIPPRAFICIEGVSRSVHKDPILLGPTVPEDFLDRPLREYLESKVAEFRSMGVKARPLAVQGHIAEEIMDFAEDSNTAIFVLSIQGPYEMKHVEVGRRDQPHVATKITRIDTSRTRIKPIRQ